LQNQAQLLAAGYGADMLKSDTQATHQAARSIIRKLPAVNWLAQEVRGSNPGWRGMFCFD